MKPRSKGGTLHRVAVVKGSKNRQRAVNVMVVGRRRAALKALMDSKQHLLVETVDGLEVAIRRARQRLAGDAFAQRMHDELNEMIGSDVKTQASESEKHAA